ncbi:MAG: hypothetical protein V3T28_05840 [Gemmatimonadales bacterium]
MLPDRSRTAPPAAGAPHAWQNFAPALREAPHDEQALPPRFAPQLLQNFPLALAPHDGHFTGYAPRKPLREEEMYITL